MRVPFQLASLLVAASCYASTSFGTDGTGQFGLLDLSTGAFTQIGGAEPSVLYGLDWEGGSLYGLDSASDPNLVIINPITGAISTVGATGLDQYSIMSAITGGSLYALDGATSDLYSINPTTGATTLVGPTGLPGAVSSYNTSISGDSTNLYVTFNQTLYIVNPANGNTTPVVGSLPSSLVDGSGLINNELYLFTYDANNPFYTINIGNAQGTLVGDTNLAVYAAVSASGAPEPGTMFLLGTALAAVSLLRLRARRKAAARHGF